MPSQSPATIAVLVVCAILALFVLYQITRIAGSVMAGYLNREQRADLAAYSAAMASLEEEVAALSDEEASRAAARILTEAVAIHIEAADPAAAPQPLRELAPAMRRVLERYSHIADPRGEPVIAWEEVGGYDYNPGYLRLGRDQEHLTLAARRDGRDEALYALADDDPDHTAVTTYPSINHWVVWLARSQGL